MLACYSGQNINRMVTLHRAAPGRAGRNLVLDLYGADIARATGRLDTIPQGDWDNVHIYIPQSQRVLVKQARQFERSARVRSRRLYPEDLSSRAGELVMTFRGSMRREPFDAARLWARQARRSPALRRRGQRPRGSPDPHAARRALSLERPCGRRNPCKQGSLK